MNDFHFSSSNSFFVEFRERVHIIFPNECPEIDIFRLRILSMIQQIMQVMKVNGDGEPMKLHRWFYDGLTFLKKLEQLSVSKP